MSGAAARTGSLREKEEKKGVMYGRIGEVYKKPHKSERAGKV